MMPTNLPTDIYSAGYQPVPGFSIIDSQHRSYTAGDKLLDLDVDLETL
jgi:hypothetical protein